MATFTEYSKLFIVEKLSLFEKIISFLVNSVGYGIGYLTVLHRLSLKGLRISDKAFRVQAIKSVDEGGGSVWRRIEARDGLLANFKNFKTIVDVFNDCVSRFGKRKCLGQRSVLSEEIVSARLNRRNEKKWLLSNFSWVTYNELNVNIVKCCSFLREAGLKKHENFAIFCETSRDWLTFALACLRISSPIVTVYSTLNDESVNYALNLTEPIGILVDEKTKARVYGMIGSLPSIKFVVISTRFKGCENDKMYEFGFGKVPCYSSNDIISREGRNSDTDLTTPCSDADTALIMFTSGSTGVPKGVVISHRNLVAILGGVCHYADYWSDHVYPAYLPLAHILEFCSEVAILSFGGMIGYCSALTLVENAPMLQEGCPGDMTVLRPTAMVAVPLILERVKKTVMSKVRQQSRMAQVVFQTAYNIRAYFYSRGYDTPILNRVVFGKLRKVFGGKLRFGLVGGAFFQRDTEEFINICFGTFKQAYGLTETCCGGSFSNIDYYAPHNTGPPIACGEIKLVPWEEGGYVGDNPDNPCGEILLYGDHVCQGYYKNEELTNTVFKVDEKTGKRWFYTGDIGAVLPDGTLRIVDRKKDFVKLTNGEYIPLAKVESVVMQSNFVDFVCVSPDIATSSGLVALIMPNRVNVVAAAKILGVKFEEGDFESIVANEDTLNVVRQDVINTCAKGKLNKFEVPKNIVVVTDVWTPESGLVTPSLKIRRQEIIKTYKSLLVI